MGGAFCGKWFSAFAKVGHFGVPQQR